MTASRMVVQQLFDAMEPYQRYYFRNLRAIESLRGIEDHRLRNALVSLQANGRVMRTGTHARYRYYVNPIQPVMRTDAARAKPVPPVPTKRRIRQTPAEIAEADELAIAATWPAVAVAARFDAAPQWRISA